MTLKNNWAPLLYYVKLCASFQIHWSSQTWVTDQKRSSPVKIGDFFVPRDLENWRMTLNKANLMDLLAATSLVILNCIQVIDFSACVSLKFDRWPRKTIGHYFYTQQALCIISNPWVNSNCSYSPETLNSGRNWWYFVWCDLEIWWMTLENNRAPLLYYIKLCASFQSHGWIQTGVTVRKRWIQVKISNFLSHVTLKFDRWPWKSIGHLSCAALCIIS